MKQPINRLLMMRTRGLSGSFFQRVGGNLLAHSSGAAIAAQSVVPPAPPPEPNLGFTMWDDGETFWDVNARTNEPATTWDRRR